jgi:uncharacterized protein
VSARSDALLLTHGAGGNCDSPLLVAVANAFEQAGVFVRRYNLPFRQKRSFGPPSPAHAADDRSGLRAALNELREQVPGRIFLGGHSYGGRQSTILASEASTGRDPAPSDQRATSADLGADRESVVLRSSIEDPSGIDGLLLLSYPLHPPNKPGQLRTAHFPALHTPSLFVHGSNDPFASVEELRAALELIPARKELSIIEGAGHDLARGKIDLARFIIDPFLRLV